MDKAVKEWIDKAEEDFYVAQSLRRLRKQPAHNAVCFHAQQAIEKLLKALLERAKIRIPKVHDLPNLLDLCAIHDPFLATMREDMLRLSIYAVEFRYPGESATEEDAKMAVSMAKRARAELLLILNA